MIRAEADRNFTFRAGVRRRRRQVRQAGRRDDARHRHRADGKWAVGRDTRGYIHDYKRPAADIYRVNTTTGERTLMLKELADRPAACSGCRRTASSSCSGRTTSSRRTTWTPAPPRRSAARRRRASWTWSSISPGRGRRTASPATRSDGKRVIAQHRYDLWLVPLDGSAAKNLTNGFGTKNEVRFRVVRDRRRSDPLADVRARAARRPRGRSIDLSKPITLSAYGEYTKKAGFFELAERPAAGNRVRGRVVQHARARGEGGHVPVHAADVRRVPGPAHLRPGLQDREEDHGRQSAAVRVPRGAAASCSTTRTRTACGCRAFSRFPTTTRPARSGR